MSFAKWFKVWGTLFAVVIALSALGLSVLAICLDNAHYQETIKPHTKHDETYDRLTRLDNKIERTEQSITTSQGSEPSASVVSQ